eukprot:TRINITY_DN8697_c0_g1_i2.p1 TRINITY_DN8697_c0_g1~~TRINITY_DN8697_c0_g1_i2.p1  ORF type:complete len:438 (-),score=42.01 TRINITY_DN8697_c0_g1_i2:132-1445(-)
MVQHHYPVGATGGTAGAPGGVPSSSAAAAATAGISGGPPLHPHSSPATTVLHSAKDKTECLAFQNFQRTWQNIAPQIGWQIQIRHSRDNQEHLIPAEVKIMPEAVSVSAVCVRECIVKVPFAVALVLTLESRKAHAFQTTISGPHGQYWTDPTGRIKFDIQVFKPQQQAQKGALSQTTVNDTCKVLKVRIQAHGQAILQQLHCAPEQPRRAEKLVTYGKGYGLTGYTLVVTLRHQDAPTPIFTSRLYNARVARIESPYQNTVVFSLPKQGSHQSNLGITEGEHQPLPFYMEGTPLPQGEKDQLKLVIDVTLYDQEDWLMWYRSSWVYPKRHLHFPSHWDACLLSEDGFWGTLSFQETVEYQELPSSAPTDFDTTKLLWGESTLNTKRHVVRTKLHDASFVVPLARINSVSKERYKLHDVAVCIIDFDSAAAASNNTP